MPGSSSATPEAKSQEEHLGWKGRRTPDKSRFGPWPVKYRRRGDGYEKTLTAPSPEGGGKDKHDKEAAHLGGIFADYLMCYKCAWTLRMGMVAMKGPTKILQQQGSFAGNCDAQWAIRFRLAAARSHGSEGRRNTHDPESAGRKKQRQAWPIRSGQSNLTE